MPSPNLAIAHVAANQNQKEVTVNDAIDALDRALTATTGIDCTAGGTISVTTAQARKAVRLEMTGAPAAAFALHLPDVPRLLVLMNATGETATVQNATGATVDLPAGQQMLIHSSGAGVTRVGARPDEAYDFGMTAFATPDPDAVLGKVVLPRAIVLPADLAGARGHVDVVPTAAFEISLTRNGGVIGAIAVDTAGLFGFATPGGAAVSLAAGDVVRFVAPATTDATVAGIAVTIAGRRA